MENKSVINPTFEKVKDIFLKYKGKPDLVLTMDSKFSDFELDSLDTVDLVMQIEDEMHVKVEMSAEIVTLGDLVTIIEIQIKKD